MSSILGSTQTTVSADTAYSTKCDIDVRLPDGFSLTCTGLNTKGNNPGTVGVMFTLVIPNGYSLHNGDGQTGAWMNSKYGSGYNEMIAGVDPDGGKGGTYPFEVWFSSNDVNGKDWTLPWVVTVNAGRNGGTPSTYTYHFTKGGSGGGHHH